MARLLLVILLLVSTVAVMARGVLQYRQVAIESIIAGEESPEQKSQSKDAKELSHEQIGVSLHLCKQAFFETLYKAIFLKALRFPKGFYDTPYNPPDTGY